MYISMCTTKTYKQNNPTALDPFTRYQTNFYLDEYLCGYTLRLHGTTLSRQVLDQQSVQVQSATCYESVLVPDKYLSGTV